MREDGRRTTAADVARLAGVSTATVSYVMNATQGRRIPPQTRDRVLSAARSLGYRPSAYAQALATGRSKVAVVEFSEVPPGVLVDRIARTVAAGLTDAGLLPVVDPFEGRSATSHSRLLTLAELLAPALVVTYAPLPDAVQQALRQRGVQRAVSVVADPDPLTSVRDAARTQVRHLQERGHTRIGYVGSGEEPLARLQAARRDGAEQECAALGIDLLDIGSAGSTAEVGEDLRRTLAAPRPPTAVAAYNDEVAFTVLGAAHQLGLSVPGQLAVIGVDDTALADAAVPPLTSVRQTFSALRSIPEVLAEPAVHSLLPPGTQVLREVVQRSST